MGTKVKWAIVETNTGLTRERERWRRERVRCPPRALWSLAVVPTINLSNWCIPDCVMRCHELSKYHIFLMLKRVSIFVYICGKYNQLEIILMRTLLYKEMSFRLFAMIWK